MPATPFLLCFHFLSFPFAKVVMIANIKPFDSILTTSHCWSMEPVPTFPSNKRYAMHFRQKSASDNFINARFPHPKLGHLSPSNVSITAFQTPETIDDALAIPHRPPQAESQSQTDRTHPRQPLPRSQSSSYWMEIRKSPQPTAPRSRKTTAATIITDPTETHPAFESDAFAIHMPTTREPILDPPIFRAKLPSPPKYEQAEGYQAYKRKAEQAREQQRSNGVRVPSRIFPYDYANRHILVPPLELEVSPPNSPAGAFPVSPPIPQQEWTPKQHTQKPSTILHSDRISFPRKPVGLGNIRSSETRPQYHHGDTNTGAIASKLYTSPSPSLKTPAIKVRLKSKAKTESLEITPPQQASSWYTRYTPSPTSSQSTSRTPSPTKPTFAYTTLPHNPIFGFPTTDISGTIAGASKNPPTTPSKPLPKSKVKSPSRWAWLRPAGPRVQKPISHPLTENALASSTITTMATATATAPTTKRSEYISPFTLYRTPPSTNTNTPTPSRPSSPKKLLRSIPLHPPSIPVAPRVLKIDKTEPRGGKFESGFAQVKRLAWIILRICLLVYALVGLYFLLDAIREAVHALGAPFRVVRMVGRVVWRGCGWVFEIGTRAWERWGVYVRFGVKGGWRGRLW